MAKDARAYIAEQFGSTRRKDFSFTDDMVFHIIYGQGADESKKALIALLNTVTGEETPVKDIRILNPIDYRKREDGKQIEFDIRLETDLGDLFDVEMEWSCLNMRKQIGRNSFGKRFTSLPFWQISERNLIQNGQRSTMCEG